MEYIKKSDYIKYPSGNVWIRKDKIKIIRIDNTSVSSVSIVELELTEEDMECLRFDTEEAARAFINEIVS